MSTEDLIARIYVNNIKACYNIIARFSLNKQDSYQS